ncbi:hypothetical protein C8R42DRAFT_726254 [Lentinula raphanica]|nr:hypothetical protein C8R42DRAFT_726254 [Lentinula raphanica]
MRCISLLLLGLISVTYALPAPSPGASQSRPSAATQARHQAAVSQAASRWTWKYYHQEPYTSRAGEKLKTNKKLFWKIQMWSKNLIEVRTFRQVFKVSVVNSDFQLGHVPDASNMFELDPRELIFRTVKPESGVFLFVESGHHWGYTAISIPQSSKHTVLHWVEFPFNVRVDFTSQAKGPRKYIVLHFEPGITHKGRHSRENPELWIPWLEEDTNLFEECDAFLSSFPEEESHSSNNPSTLNALSTLNPHSLNGPSRVDPHHESSDAQNPPPNEPSTVNSLRFPDNEDDDAPPPYPPPPYSHHTLDARPNGT